jgi:plastocyanin
MRRILVLVLAVLALAACSKQAPEVSANEQVPADQRTEAGASEGGSEGGAAGGGATWVAVDIAFDAAPETLPAGETEITLENQGSAVHNVTIDGETIVEAQGGDTETGSVNLEPGTHEYVCSVPGHDSLMNGEITVE